MHYPKTEESQRQLLNMPLEVVAETCTRCTCISFDVLRFSGHTQRLPQMEMSTAAVTKLWKSGIYSHG